MFKFNAYFFYIMLCIFHFISSYTFFARRIHFISSYTFIARRIHFNFCLFSSLPSLSPLRFRSATMRATTTAAATIAAADVMPPAAAAPEDEIPQPLHPSPEDEIPPPPPPSPASSSPDSAIDVESIVDVESIEDDNDDDEGDEEQPKLIIDEDEYGEPPVLTPEVILPVDAVLAKGIFEWSVALVIFVFLCTS